MPDVVVDPAMYNKMLGWVKIKINNKEYPVKYSLGSFFNMQEKGIDHNDPNHFSDPIKLAHIIYFGLSREAQELITVKELAFQIDVDDLRIKINDINKAIQLSLADANEDTQPKEDSKKK